MGLDARSHRCRYDADVAMTQLEEMIGRQPSRQSEIDRQRVQRHRLFAFLPHHENDRHAAPRDLGKITQS